jgi:hypothetical protein
MDVGLRNAFFSAAPSLGKGKKRGRKPFSALAGTGGFEGQNGAVFAQQQGAVAPQDG